LMALLARDRTGKGQFVDISMMDGVISWMPVLSDFLATGRLPRRGEMVLSGGKACYGVYETADGRYLSVGALEPKFWEVFCQEIGKPEFISRLNAPLDEQERMKESIAAVMKTKTLAE